MSHHSLAAQQGLLSYQLLQYHILLPSLLISKRASECEGCPSELENLRAAKLANHLAINQLTHMVVGLLGTNHFKAKNTSQICPDETSCLGASGPKPVTFSPTVPNPTVSTEEDIIPTDLPTAEPETLVLPTVPNPPVPTEEDSIPTDLPTAEPKTLGIGFSYLISLQITNFDTNYFHLCGGTIISPTWIITAAHCLDSERPSDLVVVAGVMEMGKTTGSEQIIRVEDFYKHPNYTYYYTPYEDDVALIRLAEPLFESESAEVAPLPTVSLATPGTECQEGGWGALRDNDGGSKTLKVSTVPILEKEECEKAYSLPLGDKVICAGKEGVGACVGDNGGPLVCNSVPVAIMSWREGCALPGKPAVYMDIAKYLPWIREVTKINFL